MSFVKKSIVYDQRRKLIFSTIILTFLLSFITISVYGEVISTYKITENISFSGRGITNFRLLTLILIFLAVIISIGFKEKSERLCIASMPINKDEILLTKFFCVNIAVVVPFFINFILECILYMINRDILISGGYYFQNLIVVNLMLVLSSLLIVGGVFLINLIYNNIKISIFMVIVGFLSVIYLIRKVVYTVIGSKPIIFSYIDSKMDIIISCDRAFLDMYTNGLLGTIVFLIGLIMLIYTIIIYVSITFKNDSYSNLYAFKIGKPITLVLTFIILLAISTFILGTIVDIAYLNRLNIENSTPENYTQIYQLNIKISIIIQIILIPISYLLSKKIIKKIENAFK